MNTFVLLFAVLFVLAVVALCGVYILLALGRMKPAPELPRRTRKHIYPAIPGFHRHKHI